MATLPAEVARAFLMAVSSMSMVCRGRLEPASRAVSAVAVAVIGTGHIGVAAIVTTATLFGDAATVGPNL